MFRSATERAGLALVVDTPRGAADRRGRPRDVGEDRPQPRLERLQVHLRGGDPRHAAAHRRRGDPARSRDTGTGIPDDELPRLFERFSRVRGARSRTHEGTGIGLALVQELTRLHGGSVEATSEVGAGSTFTVHIPLDRRRARRGRGRADERRRGVPRGGAALAAGRRVVGRRAGGGRRGAPERREPGRRRGRGSWSPTTTRTCASTSRACSRATGTWRPSATARRRWRRSRARRPDLVLSDVMMPELDGFGLLRRCARTRRPRSCR